MVVKGNILFILALLAISSTAYPQGWLTDENNFETNWNLTFQVGSTVLVNEMRKDFSSSSNDMINQMDLGFSFQLAKMVWERVDIGLDFGVSNFKGFRENPSNVNYLMLSGFYNNNKADFQPYPIYYDSDITNFTLFAKYNFINFSSFTNGFIKLNLYAKFGVGIVFISSELGYRNQANYLLTGLTHPLFVVGRPPDPVKNSHFSLNPSFGMNYQLNDRIFISAESGFQFLNADYVDGVHNFNNQLTPDVEGSLPEEFRVQVNDVAGKFMLGITYFFNFDSQRQNRQKALPWYSNRYRSYYSKFQTTSTKKARRERLPFYNIKFEESN